MPQTTFTIDFHQAHLSADGGESHLIDRIAHHAGDGEVCPVLSVRGSDYELKNLELTPSRNLLKGVFAKFRHDALPHAGVPNGAERELELNEGEGLIEKNHFVLHRRWNVLVWQRNGHAARIERFGDYLSDMLGDTVTFNPVLQPNAIQKLLRADLSVRKVQLKVARPTNLDLFPRPNDGALSSHVAQLMANTNAMNIELNLRGDGRSSNHQRRFLSDRLKGAVHELFGSLPVEKAKVQLEDENGVQDVVDLIAQRISSKQIVEMDDDGRYPELRSMFVALAAAWDEQRDSLQGVFGNEDNALI